MKPLPQRKSPRLQGYDYSQSGAYFVTICTHLRDYLFGDVVEDDMVLSEAGKIAHNHLGQLSSFWETIETDYFVVMPNHVHGIVVITDGMYAVPTNDTRADVGTRYIASDARKPASLGTIIGTYKAAVTREIRRLTNDPHMIVWQGRYHDHIIRNENSLHDIRHYMLTNPARWAEDSLMEK